MKFLFVNFFYTNTNYQTSKRGKTDTCRNFRVRLKKKARLKINNPAYIDLVTCISSERLLHLPEDGGLPDITTLQFIDKHHPQ